MTAQAPCRPVAEYSKGEYAPRGETANMLRRALSIVQSVEYQVSARWLFYRMYQEGWYSDKKDYANKFLKAISAARHSSFEGWAPDTLADETRQSIGRSGRFYNVGAWLQWITEAKCDLDKWLTQPVYTECWYEARAMTDQFRYYTKYITLRPMGGQPSIPYKYQAAKDIESLAEYYEKPVVILYFGDLDPAGETISEVIERDIKHWCNVDFTFIHCGLTAEQVKRYNIPQSIDKPDTYQWEAVSDTAAREIINGALANLKLRQDAFSAIENEQLAAEQWLQDKTGELFTDWNNKGGEQ